MMCQAASDCGRDLETAAVARCRLLCYTVRMGRTVFFGDFDKRLEDIADEDIDYSDIPKLTKEKLLHGTIRFPNLPPKEEEEAVARLRRFAQEYDREG